MAFESIGRELSYGDIARRVEAATGALMQAGAAPRQRIGIHCRDRLLQIVTALALSRISDSTFAFSPDGTFAPGSIDLLVTDDTKANDAVKTIRIDPTALAAARPSGPAATPSGGNSTWVFAADGNGAEHPG